MRVGFSGFLTKDTHISRLVAAINLVAEGEVVIPKKLARGMGNGFGGPRDRNAALLASQLTDRELEVLELLVEGASSEIIANRINVSRNTVRTHVQSILGKLGVHSRLEAAAFAVRHGPRATRGARCRREGSRVPQRDSAGAAMTQRRRVVVGLSMHRGRRAGGGHREPPARPLGVRGDEAFAWLEVHAGLPEHPCVHRDGSIRRPPRAPGNPRGPHRSRSRTSPSARFRRKVRSRRARPPRRGPGRLARARPPDELLRSRRSPGRHGGRTHVRPRRDPYGRVRSDIGCSWRRTGRPDVGTADLHVLVGSGPHPVDRRGRAQRRARRQRLRGDRRRRPGRTVMPNADQR